MGTQTVAAVEVEAAADVPDHCWLVHPGEVSQGVADADCGVDESKICLLGIGETRIGSVGLLASLHALEAGCFVDLVKSARDLQDVDG